jgi:hypothetical protein
MMQTTQTPHWRIGFIVSFITLVAALLSSVGAWCQMQLPADRHRRVPVLLQLNATECGAACLAMVIGCHGRPTRVAEVRDAIGIVGMASAPARSSPRPASTACA